MLQLWCRGGLGQRIVWLLGHSGDIMTLVFVCIGIVIEWPWFTLDDGDDVRVDIPTIILRRWGINYNTQL